MTKKRRNIVFGIIAVLFVLTAVGAVFYSLGWRFDLETKKPIQPGMFYFKALPKNCEATITPIDNSGNAKGNAIIKKTDFFSGSVIFENLKPQKYKIQIKKDGYISWEKILEIKEKEATEAKNIYLIPQDPIFTAVSQNTENFYFSPDNKKIIIKEINTAPSDGWQASRPVPRSFGEGGSLDEGWALKLFEPEKNIKSFLIKEADISKSGAELKEIIFSPDSKKIIIKAITRENIEYYFLDLDKSPNNLTLLDFIDSSASEIYFIPENLQKLLVLSSSPEESGGNKKIISRADLTEKKLSPPLIKNIIACQPSKSNIYCMDSQGFLIKSDFSFEQIDKMNLIPYPVEENKKYAVFTYSSKIGIWEENSLYLLDQKTGIFQKISDSAENVEFSPDNKKLVFSDGYEIKILFLEKTDDRPERKAGEQIFITRYSSKIKNIFWYTDHYLIFNSRDKIKIAEIDDRDKINITELSPDISSVNGELVESKSLEIFWSQSQKKLFLLSENAFYISEKLIP